MSFFNRPGRIVRTFFRGNGGPLFLDPRVKAFDLEAPFKDSIVKLGPLLDCNCTAFFTKFSSFRSRQTKGPDVRASLNLPGFAGVFVFFIPAFFYKWSLYKCIDEFRKGSKGHP